MWRVFLIRRSRSSRLGWRAFSFQISFYLSYLISVISQGERLYKEIMGRGKIVGHVSALDKIQRLCSRNRGLCG